MTLSPGGLEVAIMLAGALLALWFVIRFPNAGPATPWMALVHVMVACTIGGIIVGPAMGFFRGLPVPNSLTVAIVAGALPPAFYLLTSLAWFVQNIQRMLAPYR
jgi:hypothetical protein